MKYTYLIVALALVVAVGGVVYVGATKDTTSEAVMNEVIIFTDENNNQFTIVYSDNQEDMTLSLNGVQHQLSRAEAASGAKYESVDGNVVFWEKGGEANVEVGGELIFKNALTEARRVEVLKSNNQVDSNANKYEQKVEPCNAVDQDCTGGDDFSGTKEARCGDGTTLEEGKCNTATLDDDHDGDTLGNESPNSATASMNADEETQADKATDYNSSRSNRTTQ